MNELVTTFDFHGQDVRAVTVEGEPCFIAADVCRVLSIQNARRAVNEQIDSDGVRTTYVTDSLGRQQTAYAVTEAGLYELVFQSRRPEAKAFRRWVTGTVLPEIRKTGSYGIDKRNVAELTSRADLARMVLESEEEKAVLSAALESATPAIEYHDRFVANDDAVTVGAWAAQYGLTDPQARTLLLAKNIIYKFSIGERWSAKHRKVVEEFEYRARAGRVSFAWFDLRPQHNAPRHHNGQVRQTLYVRQQYSIDLGRKLGLTPAPVQTEIAAQDMNLPSTNPPRAAGA